MTPLSAVDVSTVLNTVAEYLLEDGALLDEELSRAIETSLWNNEVRHMDDESLFILFDSLGLKDERTYFEDQVYQAVSKVYLNRIQKKAPIAA